MKLVIDGYGKSIHKKDNQIHEKDEIIDSIKASLVSDITVAGKGYVTFDALDLMAMNNIKLIAINSRGQMTYVLESPDWRNVELKKMQYQSSENSLGIEISRKVCNECFLVNYSKRFNPIISDMVMFIYINELLLSHQLYQNLHQKRIFHKFDFLSWYELQYNLPMINFHQI